MDDKHGENKRFHLEMIQGVVNRLAQNSFHIKGWSVVLVAAREAHGYIDPGTGSFILQVALSSLLGMAVAIKMFWKQILAFIGRILSKRRKSDSDEE